MTRVEVTNAMQQYPSDYVCNSTPLLLHQQSVILTILAHALVSEVEKA